MKHLEAIGMVQYFLYERMDLDIGLNTAFLGPNGTGKTALLDALQIVLLAADSNRTHFNASGEGRRRARTLRDYCLGVYGQTEAERYRPSANTYISLVFRDQDTGLAVTAGVSLAAQDDNPDLVFNGLYILPGVALSTADHIERDGAREIVLPWRRFQHAAGDQCRLAGTIPIFTTNREEFSRRLYVEHLASAGERPNVRAIRSAFARSLKLNKDVADLNETLREHLIEQRLTNVRQFKARLLQFRDMRELVRQVRDRISRVSAVAEQYATVERERTVEANVACLAAIYETERVGEVLGETQDKAEKLAEDLATKRTELIKAEADAQIEEQARDRALQARNDDPDFAKQSAWVDRLNGLEGDWQSKRNELLASLENAIGAVAGAGRLPTLADAQSKFEDGLNKLIGLREAIETHSLPGAEELQAVAQSVAQIHEQVRRALGTAEIALRAAQDAKRDAQTAMERAKKGFKQGRPSVVALQRMLADAGIEATPVSDLVRVNDESWQPALEAYLASHTDGLLIKGGREKELAAVDLYKGLRGEQRVFRVKLAMPGRGQAWQARGGKSYAARLIEGDRDAVWYLQGVLGQLSLANSSEELIDGSRAITREGMVSGGGSVERLELPKVSDLVIGRGDVASLELDAAKAQRQADDAFNLAEQITKGLQAALPRLATFADASDAQDRLGRLFSAEHQAARLVSELQERLAAAHTDQLGSLESALEKATRRRDQTRDRVKVLSGEVGGLVVQLDVASKSSSALEKQLSLAQSHEATCRQDPLYNANEVDRHRIRYDARHEDDIEAKQHSCRDRIRRANAAATEADHQGWTWFCQYAADFTLQNHDLTKVQWQRVFQYVLADKQRMESLDLVQREAEAEEAYAAAVNVFRTDVAQVLLEGFEAIDDQINGLNQILKAAPEFSNGERYQFKHKPVEQHRALYDFLKRVRQQGDEEIDIFGGSGRVPEEFRALVESDSDSELLQETSPLNDHRRFFGYDVEIFHDEKSMGWLSKRFGPGSGGEHRTPLYVIFGAALAAAYGKSRGVQTTGGLIMLDEAFEKMDAQNVRATAKYLNALGLQMIMAGPETDQPKMSSFLNVYYDMARFGSRTIQMTKNVVLEEARELLQSDNFLLHPELLENEMKSIAESEHGSGR